MVVVGIVGLGSWGLCSLERIVHACRQAPEASVSVHVIEPERPGGGLYSVANPDYIILNTPCGQHCMYPYPEELDEGLLGKSFYQWVVDEGYSWHGHDCQLSSGGTAIEPHDFLPRRLMGEYLEWFYRQLLREAPPNVSVHHHPARAVDVEPTPEGRERIYFADGRQLTVDHVVLTTGHATQPSPEDRLGELATGPYPVDAHVGSVKPGERILIEGMGLVALDVVTALTVGLGGTYADEGDGRLRYHPSGREPALYLYSRSGYPYCAKSLGTADPLGDYEPLICTPAAIDALRQASPRGQIDARQQLLPVVFAEMELRYYSRAVEIDQGTDAAEAVRQDLAATWGRGTFEAALRTYAGRYGYFSAADHFFVGEGQSYLDAKDYEEHVYRVLQSDTEEALVPGGASPTKAAYETLRALRDTLRQAVEFRGLSKSSYLDFQANLRNRFARLVAGPPVVRSQQLLALLEAGVVKLALGPSPELKPAPGGGVVASSTGLDRPIELHFERLIRAHVDTPSVGGPASPLLDNLARRGRAKPLSYDGQPVGSIDLTEDFHPVNTQGLPERRLWVFGAPSEGVRYFTLYIPSPKSRARAFVDAERCATEIVGRAG